MVNLREYYNLVRVHTNNSFRISLLTGVVGFVLIAAGLTIGFNARADTRTIAYLSAASGVFVEFMSGVFFWLYSRTVRQLKAYHDSLLDVQDVLLSLKLIERVGDDKRSEIILNMLGYLVRRARPGHHDWQVGADPNEAGRATPRSTAGSTSSSSA